MVQATPSLQRVLSALCTQPTPGSQRSLVQAMSSLHDGAGVGMQPVVALALALPGSQRSTPVQGSPSSQSASCAQRVLLPPSGAGTSASSAALLPDSANS